MFLDYTIVVIAVSAVVAIVGPVVDYNESKTISDMLNIPMFTIFAYLIDVKLHDCLV